MNARENAASDFGNFLKTLRKRIPPETATLGPLERLPIRRGRPVSQEEMAELVGVSRVWYQKLESDTEARVSLRLLDKLANALVFDADERTKLFVLAIPEIREYSSLGLA